MATRKRKAPDAPAPPTTLDELRRLAEDGDSDEARLVYADALMAAGDARGELIALEVGLEKYPALHPRRIELEEREALLFAQHRKEWEAGRDVKEAYATVSVEYRRGLVDRVTLEGVRWNFVKQLSAALGRSVRAATTLSVRHKLDWRGLATILEALPRATSLDLESTSRRAWVGTPGALFDHPVAAQLTSLSYGLDQLEYEPLRAALTAKTSRLTRLRRLGLVTPLAHVLPAAGEMESSTGISEWNLRAGDLDRAMLIGILTANGRRGADRPVRALEVWSQRLDGETLPSLAREVPARYRALELTAEVPLGALTDFLRSDAASELETLTTLRSQPHASARTTPAPVETPLRALHIRWVDSEDVAELVATVRAPALRSLQLLHYGSSPDGLARLFDSPWLDTVESLHLDANDAEPFIARVQRTESALTSLRLGSGQAETQRELVDWRGLSRLRELSTRYNGRFDGETLRRLLAGPARSSLEILRVDLERGAIAALEGTAAPPRLAWLELDIRDLSDADVEALARWPGVRGLRGLRLHGYSERLTEKWVDFVVDRALFPNLTFVARAAKLGEAATARLRDRFGAGIAFYPPPRSESFVAF